MPLSLRNSSVCKSSMSASMVTETGVRAVESWIKTNLKIHWPFQWTKTKTEIVPWLRLVDSCLPVVKFIHQTGRVDHSWLQLAPIRVIPCHDLKKKCIFFANVKLIKNYMRSCSFVSAQICPKWHFSPSRPELVVFVMSASLLQPVLIIVTSGTA